MVEGVQASTEDMESAEYRAEEKVARPSVLAPIRGKLMVANVMVLLSSICSVPPLILIVEAFRRLLEGSTEGVWPLLMWALAAYAARAILYSGALFWTHSVDADNQLGMRRLTSDKLRSVPLGWFNERRSADVKSSSRMMWKQSTTWWLMRRSSSLPQCPSPSMSPHIPWTLTVLATWKQLRALASAASPSARSGRSG